ncbi:Lsr2 family protein [Streptomyces longispororuber]|uniref:histone-like nucleoid-structuring protein Lsr2 n=1 Tax=Streptomyces longispororuber TaxID=68230 RepID=UPI0033E23A1D
MAQKTIVLLTDDLDGSEADETVAFGLDGRQYEIDLATANADKLRGLLDPFLKAGRRRGGSSRGRGARQTFARKTAVGPNSGDIRAWAKKNGFEVNDRGRVPATIREAYEKANG